MKQPYDHSFHAFIQGIILVGFAMLMLHLILTGNIVYYIAPMMMPFIYFALVVFFLLGIMQVFRSTAKTEHNHHDCTCEHDHHIKGPSWVKMLIYSIFILPIVLGFAFPDRSLDSSVAANRGIQLGGGTSSVADNNTDDKIAQENESSTSRAEAFLEDPEAYMDSLTNSSTAQNNEHYQFEDIYEEGWFDDYYAELHEELMNRPFIEVTEDNYLDVMTVLDLYLDDFIGEEMEIVGFAYREADFQANQIVAARFAMTCCTADASVYGTMIESEESDKLEEDTWISARGTIKKGYYLDQPIPILVDAHIQEVEEPASPYVYPNF
ncbi:TIGR03943 family protein [Salipaludibacillus sp. LMS25]|jgi:putative membrane protein|uniref:TIGR03943 family putative permease subunit n=1 Tax=Salipaludibacillus sp. LMS25 TaxID=2924031 RepID=UPI0020D18335|nr:TIGR03943 family protein [Salipaludibacillus sp. LMS25]UTR14550.1 TIGR03943 family protein [Salipaludibacillus sp. LMS25]